MSRSNEPGSGLPTPEESIRRSAQERSLRREIAEQHDELDAQEVEVRRDDSQLEAHIPEDTQRRLARHDIAREREDVRLEDIETVERVDDGFEPRLSDDWHASQIAAEHEEISQQDVIVERDGDEISASFTEEAQVDMAVQDLDEQTDFDVTREDVVREGDEWKLTDDARERQRTLQQERDRTMAVRQLDREFEEVDISEENVELTDDGWQVEESVQEEIAARRFDDQLEFVDVTREHVVREGDEWQLTEDVQEAVDSVPQVQPGLTGLPEVSREEPVTVDPGFTGVPAVQEQPTVRTGMTGLPDLNTPLGLAADQFQEETGPDLEREADFRIIQEEMDREEFERKQQISEQVDTLPLQSAQAYPELDHLDGPGRYFSIEITPSGMEKISRFREQEAEEVEDIPVDIHDAKPTENQFTQEQLDEAGIDMSPEIFDEIPSGPRYRPGTQDTDAIPDRDGPLDALEEVESTVANVPYVPETAGLTTSGIGELYDVSTTVGGRISDGSASLRESVEDRMPSERVGGLLGTSVDIKQGRLDSVQDPFEPRTRAGEIGQQTVETAALAGTTFSVGIADVGTIRDRSLEAVDVTIEEGVDPVADRTGPTVDAVGSGYDTFTDMIAPADSSFQARREPNTPGSILQYQSDDVETFGRAAGVGGASILGTPAAAVDLGSGIQSGAEFTAAEVQEEGIVRGLESTAVTGGAMAQDIGEFVVEETREDPVRAAGLATGGILVGAGASVAGGRALGAAVRGVSRGVGPRVRTAGGTRVDADDLAQQQIIERIERGERAFPGAQDPTLYRDAPAVAVRQQAREFTPAAIQRQFQDAGVDGPTLMKALDVEPDGPRFGRVGGFATRQGDYENPGAFVGPELSPHFLRIERQYPPPEFRLRPGLPRTGESPTAVAIRTDVEHSDSVTMADFRRELLQREGDDTAITKPPETEGVRGGFTPEEIEAVIPPSSEFVDIGTGPVRNLLRRVGIGADFYTEVQGQRVPIRTVAPADEIADTGPVGIRGLLSDERGQVGGPVRTRRVRREIDRQFSPPVDRPAPVGPATSQPSQPPRDMIETQPSRQFADLSRVGIESRRSRPTTPFGRSQPTASVSDIDRSGIASEPRERFDAVARSEPSAGSQRMDSSQVSSPVSEISQPSSPSQPSTTSVSFGSSSVPFDPSGTFTPPTPGRPTVPSASRPGPMTGIPWTASRSPLRADFDSDPGREPESPLSGQDRVEWVNPIERLGRDSDRRRDEFQEGIPWL